MVNIVGFARSPICYTYQRNNSTLFSSAQDKKKQALLGNINTGPIKVLTKARL
jgi:hypothetical protein